MKDSDLHSLRFVVGQLRHAYQNMINVNVTPRNMRSLADGLISSQISSIEQIIKNEEAARSTATTSLSKSSGEEA